MIINLTQHTATPEQIAQGVVDLAGERLTALKNALTFDTLPVSEDVVEAAEEIAALAASHFGVWEDANSNVPEAAMIGGAPFLMAALERALRLYGIKPLYAFSVRDSVEKTCPDTGAVTKTAIFKHVGFIEATR